MPRYQAMLRPRPPPVLSIPQDKDMEVQLTFTDHSELVKFQRWMGKKEKHPYFEEAALFLFPPDAEVPTNWGCAYVWGCFPAQTSTLWFIMEMELDSLQLIKLLDMNGALVSDRRASLVVEHEAWPDLTFSIRSEYLTPRARTTPVSPDAPMAPTKRARRESGVRSLTLIYGTQALEVPETDEE